ncbi:MAG: hypothetical protein ACFHW5_13215 [Verrucomicrobiota bacterium]
MATCTQEHYQTAIYCHSIDLGLPDKAGQTLLSGPSLHPVLKESDKTFKTPQH